MATSSFISRWKFLEKFTLVAILVWVVLVFAHYFPIQKVFDLSFLKSIFSNPGLVDARKLLANGGNFLKNLFYALLIGFVFWRAGRKLLHWLGLKLDNIPLRFSM